MIYDFDDLHVTALTLIGEARGEGDEGLTAVAWVIRNRTEHERWPNKARDVCKEDKQFSCWNNAPWNRGNHIAMARADWTDPLYRRAMAITAAVFERLVNDPTGGANHYFNAQFAQPPWAEGEDPVAMIGSHTFYRF